MQADVGGPRTITRLLIDWENGDEAALDELTPLVYKELHALARIYLSRGRRSEALQPTELIDELYFRLIDRSATVHWENRSHFFGIAARLMRQVLVDHARAHRAAKRGGGADAVTLEETMALSPGRAPDVLEVDEALCAPGGGRRAQGEGDRAALFCRHETRGSRRSRRALTLPTVKRDLRLVRPGCVGISRATTERET